jgi:hypothetical protein
MFKDFLVLEGRDDFTSYCNRVEKTAIWLFFWGGGEECVLTNKGGGNMRSWRCRGRWRKTLRCSERWGGGGSINSAGERHENVPRQRSVRSKGGGGDLTA